MQNNRNINELYYTNSKFLILVKKFNNNDKKINKKQFILKQNIDMQPALLNT
jgi:hypothetical protein